MSYSISRKNSGMAKLWPFKAEFWQKRTVLNVFLNGSCSYRIEYFWGTDYTASCLLLFLQLWDWPPPCFNVFLATSKRPQICVLLWTKQHIHEYKKMFQNFWKKISFFPKGCWPQNLSMLAEKCPSEPMSSKPRIRF